MSTQSPVQTVPSHVPQDVVRDYPLSRRATTTENPHSVMIPRVHEGPEIFYALDIYPNGSPAWVFRRAEDMRAVYLNNDNFTKRGHSGVAALIGEDWDIIPSDLDPPRHSAFRVLLNPLFTPKKMELLNDKVRSRARAFVAAFKDKGECDAAAEFAVPYPVSIFLDLLGVPQERMAEFLRWKNQMLHSPDLRERAAGVWAVKQYLLEAIEDRRKHPTDDLISNALRLEVDGRPFTPDEVFGHCFNLYLGGLDTVSSNISLHLRHLADDLEQQRRLRADPSLIPTALDELLRAYAAVTTFRICNNGFDYKGVRIEPGDKVALATPLAGRDPAEYAQPNDIRLDRRPVHLTFGYGIHRCLGAHLARRELNIALEEFLAGVPEFRVRPGKPVEFYTGSILHVPYLPLVWEPA